MEAGTNQISNQETFSSSFHGGRIVSFQSGSANISTEMISVDMSRFAGANNMSGIFMCSSPGTNSHFSSEPLRRLTHTSGLPADWSAQELEILREGIVRYSNEQGVKKYTKLAAMLPAKTIRDVALRCQWMTTIEKSKRKKGEDYQAANRTKCVKLVSSTSTSNSSKASSEGMCSNPLMMHRSNSCNQFPSTDMQQRLGENILNLRKIANNLQNGQLQENAHLFLTVRENIAALQHRINMMPATINQLPGSMKQMPPFPVSINEQLLNNFVSLNRNDFYVASVNNDLRTGPSYLGPNIR